MIYHPSPAVLCLEVSPPITGQDHRKLPSVGTMATGFVDGASKLMCYLEQMKYDTGEAGAGEVRGRILRDGHGDREECVAWKTKEPNLRETGDGEPSRIAGRGMDEKRRDKAFAPALYRTQGSAITRVLAAGRSGRSALALPSNTLLPRCPPAPRQHPLLCFYLQTTQPTTNS